jgi:hypothetical protein
MPLALIADFIHRRHHRRPILVPFQQFHPETLPEPFPGALLAAEFPDVKYLNPLARDPNPLLRPKLVLPFRIVPTEPKGTDNCNSRLLWQRSAA